MNALKGKIQGGRWVRLLLREIGREQLGARLGGEAKVKNVPGAAVREGGKTK